MTSFDKIRSYYSAFDEDGRLTRDASGRLEFSRTLQLLQRWLPSAGAVLDLGGAAGTYAFPLAAQGYQVTLADLSAGLIDHAKAKLRRAPQPNLVACDVVNAIDLSRYPDARFDAVLLLGPLYHLLEAAEREQCIREVQRVLKPGGLVFASFIPHLSGSIAIVDRYFFDPAQVGPDTLREVFRSGRFVNAADHGFQEGYYPTSGEIVRLFAAHGFDRLALCSVRGFGYGREEQLFALQDEAMRREILHLIESTASAPEIIETCGHALYVGRRT